MADFASNADRLRIEAEMPYEARGLPETIRAFLGQAAARFPDRPAVSFQLTSDPRGRAETLDWRSFEARTLRTANLLRDLGIGPQDRVAMILPNCNEAAEVLLGGMIAGVICPINPLLEPPQIAAILRETGARVVVTLRAVPKSDIAAKVALALAEAPAVEAVLEVDLLRYLPAPKRWVAALLRPSAGRAAHGAKVLDFGRERAARPATLAADAPAGEGDRIAACFHTGGTTGMPKLAQHRPSGMIYNGWLGAHLLFDEHDVLICPLPLFHVFAAYPILMSCIASGAHMVMPTPAGYRGEGVFDNFWKLIARWRVSFLITVPTAIAALMQRPVDADVSSLRIAISGSAPLPVELYQRFRAATGVGIAEGYGLTEATCLVSCNPPAGPQKIGSVGIPMPYCEVRILDAAGGECPADTIGEICLASPGLVPGSQHVTVQPASPYGDRPFLRTGDLGRLDADGYLWITGRAKDLIIRGGHNIDPAGIEAALLSHPAVAFAGAIGQPDAVAGELPCAYVELVAGASVDAAILAEHARGHVPERAAIPRHVEILDELPKTAVGKIFKPALRARAIARVLDAHLASTGLPARVAEVTEDRRRGLVARIVPTAGPRPLAEGAADAAGAEALGVQVAQAMAGFALQWDWAPTGKAAGQVAELAAGDGGKADTVRDSRPGRGDSGQR